MAAIAGSLNQAILLEPGVAKTIPLQSFSGEGTVSLFSTPFTAARTMGVTTAAAVQTLSQGGRAWITSGWDGMPEAYMSFEQGNPVSFDLPGYTLTVTPLAEPQTYGSVSGYPDPGSWSWRVNGTLDATFLLTAVPEPSTLILIAGALLLLPFRAGLVRKLRK